MDKAPIIDTKPISHQYLEDGHKSIKTDKQAAEYITLLLAGQRDADHTYYTTPHWQDRPKIVCLCGSTRFVDIYNEYRKIFTLKGYIVLSIEIVTTQSQKDDPQFSNTELKKMLDELHKRKIDLADEVFIINKGGYIGESTLSEINYALQHQKPISYLEQPSLPEGE